MRLGQISCALPARLASVARSAFPSRYQPEALFLIVGTGAHYSSTEPLLPLRDCFGFTFLDPRLKARVEAQRVVPENLPLQLVADVFTVDQVRDVLAEVALVALVRIV